ncbi:hypothetical protein DPMN_169937 [Dreissena polymorpha]|uniref:Uncharacterized protein n=1 Tax=Dreissena polymorpha TaxID=45954 RepID=A0A9D4DYC5_DREPO|nr:hypothetical protein DPMN_169937 [Dreissena polymorpha]
MCNVCWSIVHVLTSANAHVVLTTGWTFALAWAPTVKLTRRKQSQPMTYTI